MMNPDIFDKPQRQTGRHLTPRSIMPTITAQHIFDLPGDDLWNNYLGSFGEIGKWSGRPPDACVREGEGIGSLRTLTLDDGGVIVDRLEAQGERSYSYSIVSSPLPFRSYYATMSVEDVDDNTSRLTWTGVVEPAGISDEQAIRLTESIYKMGIGLMQQAVSARGDAKR